MASGPFKSVSLYIHMHEVKQILMLPCTTQHGSGEKPLQKKCQSLCARSQGHSLSIRTFVVDIEIADMQNKLQS